MDKAPIESIIKKKMDKDPEKLLPFKSLLELGLSRHKCKVCGKNFWSSVDKDLCGDVDCIGDYTFLDRRITNKKLGYKEIWDAFAKMFKKSGHKEIKRYPVVARWRSDIYFVEAAIDDFAPYVIKGIANPPANPLVVPQICMRFNDINNVGLSGRHMTSFIMAEEAAFNTAKKKVYFDREAIKYIYEWLIKGLGVEKNELTFVEDAWAGAGYAGNCLEFFAGGLELGNQVYMRYIIEGDQLVDMPTKTIDMGAGLERWAWISQSTPTVYDSTFPKTIKFIKDTVGVSYDDSLLKRIYKFMGKVDFEKTSLSGAIDTLSKETGIEPQKLKKIISDMQAIYSIADHTRTLLVAIHDGALPSNVGGGYNLRNIIRRALGFIDNKNWKLDLNKVVDVHKKEFGLWFDELNEFDISKVIDKEVERYSEFKSRNSKFISSLLDKGKIDPKEMKELYESRGITIDDIKIRAEAEGKEIVLPEKFYSDINQTKTRREHNANEPDIKGIPKTKKLFYDEKLTEGKAKVIKTLNDGRIILDKTIFYPEMGGQKPDRGKIDGHNVNDVRIYDDVIVHEVSEKYRPKEKKEVTMKIDSERRELLRKHHTATHIINQAARRVLGGFVYQNGAEKDVDKAHLDITYYDKLTEDQVRQIENLANEVVSSNLEINVNIMDRTEAETRYGMSIYQGGAIPNAQLRVVNIGDYDVEACGGLHCDRSGDVGLIKIVKTERIQDGVVRLTFMAFKPAISYTQEQDKLIRELTGMWGVQQNELYKTAERFFSEAKSYKEMFKKAEVDRVAAILGQLQMKKQGNVDVIDTKINELGIISGFIKNYGRSAVIVGDTIGVGKPKNQEEKDILAKKYKIVVEKGDFLFGHN